MVNGLLCTLNTDACCMHTLLHMIICFQIFNKDYASSKRAYRDWRKGKRSGSGSGFKQWRKMG